MALRPSVSSSMSAPDEIRKHRKRSRRISVSVQLHGQISRLKSCRELAQEFRVIRALPTDVSFHPKYDRFILTNATFSLDAYHPNLRGGTGR